MTAILATTVLAVSTAYSPCSSGTIMADTRTCEGCGVTVHRKSHQKLSNFIRGRFCGRSCGNRHTDRPYWVEEDCGYTTPCHTWARFVYDSGYGQYRIAGTTWLAHRYFYTQAHGPIPEGYEVDHLCENKRCVNVEHLEAVTSAENSRRSSHTRLTADDVREIRRAPKGVTSRAMSKRYGIHESWICRIRRGEGWEGIA